MADKAIYLDVGLSFDPRVNPGLIPKVNNSRVNQGLIPKGPDQHTLASGLLITDRLFSCPEEKTSETKFKKVTHPGW